MNKHDVLILGDCCINLPMRVSGTTRLSLSKRDTMTFVLRGGSVFPETRGALLQVEDLKFTSHDKLRTMMNALFRYACFMDVKKVRLYSGRETAEFLKQLGFEEDVPVSSLIYALTYNMEGGVS